MRIPKLVINSRNTEVNAVTGRISDEYHQKLEGDLTLGPLFVEIDSGNQKLTVAIERMKAESDLEVMDAKRDSAHHSLYYFVYGLSLSSTAATRSAATQILAVLNHYGLAVTEENYDMESSKLDSLLLDLASPELAAAIAVLTGSAALIADLQTAQDAFKAARLAYQEECAAEGLKSNATHIKRDVVKLINDKLITVLNGLVVTAPDTYTAFATVVVEIIATNNEVVKKRKIQQPEPTELV
ncbi:DUF6261 family protein [Mangrovibacterium lignilyticum]|uniref:DUF6261 family protein n=1 Tax=Mangrovibacterium lignilyticum TaxID=2668052 RepID=UPI0013D276DC|nr:DUF6261 family protein [Mangrovibacterium lignilyticum]